MRHRIAIYGGTDLEPDLARFVRHLGRAVVRHPDLILVTGGYWYRTVDDKTDSAEVVPAYSADKIQLWFKLTRAERHSLELVNLESMDEKSMTELAERVVEYLRRRIERRCLTLMPFEDDAKSYFEAVLRKSVQDAGFKIVRVDLEPEAGLIYRKFVSHLAGADVVLADLTGYNPNVMYELGHVHANGGTPFLYQRSVRHEDLDDSSIPFDLKGHAIERVVASKHFLLSRPRFCPDQRC